MFLQEANRQGPCFGGGLFIAHAVVWIKEGMSSFVDFHGEVFVGIFVHLLNLLYLSHGDSTIFATVECHYRPMDFCHLVGCRVVSTSIEGHKSTQVSITSGHRIDEEATDAEAYQAQLLW